MNKKHIEILARVTNTPANVIVGRFTHDFVTPKQALAAMAELQKEIDQLNASLSACQRMRVEDAYSAINEANELREKIKQLTPKP